MTPGFCFNVMAVLLAGLFNWMWLWSIAQIFFAGVVCWFLLDLAHQPIPETFDKVFTPETFNQIFPTLPKAALVGIGFNAVLNADEATDFLGLNLGAIYKRLIDPITLKIHATQARHTDRFWAELRSHLTNLSTAQINDGMNLIREKLTNSKNLTKERRDTLWIAVNQIQDPEISSQKRPEKIVKLLKDFVRRHDLPEILNVLGCEEEFLRTYVPKRSQTRFLSNR
jgi:hypothetical protein